MFGVGFFEIVIIAVAALIFVGPKKLPELMRQAGKLFVQVRRTTNEVRSTIDQVIREAENDLAKADIEKLKKILETSTAAVTIEAQSVTVNDPHSSPNTTPEGALPLLSQGSHEKIPTEQSHEPAETPGDQK